MNLKVALSGSHRNRLPRVNRYLINQDLLDDCGLRELVQPVGINHDHALDGRKPKLSLPVFPSGRLAAAIRFCGLHSVCNAIRDTGDRFDSPIGQLIQLFATGAVDATVATHPQIAMIVFENSRNDVVEQSVSGCNRSEATILETVQAPAICAYPKGAICV